MKYKIVTYGCQMNEHDSERIAYLLENMGYQPTEEKNEADFILYNTCLVRENAELKVYGQIGTYKKWKEENPDKILAISGCMMQTGPARDIIKKKYPQVDLVFGTRNIAKLPQLLARHKETGERVFDIEAYEDDQLDYDRTSSSFAYVNISTGCNNFCSYCVVPYARGRETSRSSEEIITEVEALAARGYKEIMLLGQNVNSYGNDGDEISFAELLRRVHEIDGIERIRFMSSHPKDVPDELIDVIAESPKIERHFHLALQSGSNKVLKEMNRKYTREQFIALAKKLRDRIPGIALSTDIIVGFPGETEEDHQDTMDLCKEVKFDSAFTFIYSPRPDTQAAKREDQIPEEVASRRFQELLDVIYPIFLESNQKDVGKKSRVLLETVSKNNDQMLSGRDAENKLVHVPGDASMIGEMVDVEIVSCNSFSLTAKRI